MAVTDESRTTFDLLLHNYTIGIWESSVSTLRSHFKLLCINIFLKRIYCSLAKPPLSFLTSLCILSVLKLIFYDSEISTKLKFCYSDHSYTRTGPLLRPPHSKPKQLFSIWLNQSCYSGLMVLLVKLCFRNKTYVPVFYCGNKIWVQVLMHMN